MLFATGLVVDYCWRVSGTCFGYALWFALMLYSIGGLFLLVSGMVAFA